MLIITFYKLCLCWEVCCDSINVGLQLLCIMELKKEAFAINWLEDSPVNVKVKEEKCESGKLSASMKQGGDYSSCLVN